jgi:hypothetical protein
MKPPLSKEYAMQDSMSPLAREAILEVIENQMRDGTPPETKQTFDRLLAEGYSREETMKLLSFVILRDLSEMVKKKEMFNEQRYVAALHALPDLQLDDDD